MGHTFSQRAYMAKCYAEKAELYAELAKQLATDKKLTIFYREKVRIEYRIKGKRLKCSIFNTVGEICFQSIDYDFSYKIASYLEDMRFIFAKDEAEAREIYNYDVKFN